jgi:hypothetical protein
MRPDRAAKIPKHIAKDFEFISRLASPRRTTARRPERRRLLEIDPVLFSQLLEATLASARK